MEEHTLKLAQNLARQASITSETSDQESESIITEARDGNPTPLKSMAAKLEEKVKGFRYVLAYLRTFLIDYSQSWICTYVCTFFDKS